MRVLAIQSRDKQCGSALIAVFWLIAILFMVVFTTAALLEHDTREARVLRGRGYAQRYAEQGLAIGQHPRIQPGDPLLRQADDLGGYEVSLTNEEARFNLNALAINKEGQQLLRRIFRRWGLEFDETGQLIDALKDFIDADERVELNGAERRFYEDAGLIGLPPNRPLQSLDEAELVRGWYRVAEVKPDWRRWFTRFGSGRLEVNDAAPELIATIANVPIERVAPVTQLRLGPDGQRDTDDDGRVGSAKQLAQLLGVFQPHMISYLEGWTQYDGELRRIESQGWFGEESRRLVIVSQGDQLLWRGEVGP